MAETDRASGIRVELTTCPACGGSGVVAHAGAASSEPQTLADRDQTSSDRDQTWSDQDQTASDLDQQSAAEDQSAADQDLAAGTDPELHERSRAKRVHAARTRAEVSVLRDESAAARVTTAEERDRAASERDRELAERHGREGAFEERLGPAVAEALRRAAVDRERAAADRARAAADREAAAGEREEARRALAEAEQEVTRAATDELTGAWTRRFGFEQITRELERTRRTGGTLTLAFIDVDGLKAVNDRHGHAAGDRLLRLAAETMRANLRPYDIVTRYGGDEFLCVMPHTNKDVAAQRLTAVAAMLSAAETGHSISFGLAEHQPSEGLQELVQRADGDLIAARRSRRHDA